MAEIKIGTQNPGDVKVSETRVTPQHGDPTAVAESPRENPRDAIRAARAARLKVITGPAKTVKVFAANESMRMLMRHANGTRFGSALDQGVEWPIDGFTTRRLAEGSISTEPGSGDGFAEADQTTNPREQAAANKPRPKGTPKVEPHRSEPKSNRSPPPAA
jgi:hypothetical protein